MGVAIGALSGAGPGAPLTAADQAGVVYTLSAGQLGVRDIEFDLPDGVTCGDLDGELVGATCDDDAGEDKLVVAGPFVVDLVARTATPSLAEVRIPAGTYRRVDVRVEPTPALDGAALAATLAFSWDATPSTVALRLRLNEDIRTEAPGGVVVAAGDDLVARFVIDGWLAGADVVGCLEAEGAAPGDDAVIDDDAGGCGDLEDAIKENFKESADLGDS
ncbi:MAG: hypothetical protein R2939_22490, partial [Kofleriaceae bacterium]